MELPRMVPEIVPHDTGLYAEKVSKLARQDRINKCTRYTSVYFKEGGQVKTNGGKKWKTHPLTVNDCTGKTSQFGQSWNFRPPRYMCFPNPQLLTLKWWSTLIRIITPFPNKGTTSQVQKSAQPQEAEPCSCIIKRDMIERKITATYVSRTLHLTSSPHVIFSAVFWTKNHGKF